MVVQWDLSIVDTLGLSGSCTHVVVQWDLSIMDTLGLEKQFVIQRVPLFRGCFICTTFYADPQKQSVIERFPPLGEFVISNSTDSVH